MYLDVSSARVSLDKIVEAQVDLKLHPLNSRVNRRVLTRQARNVLIILQRAI
jgi:hypothetical protein